MKKSMIALGFALSFAISHLALAEEITYKVEGMHCGSCAKMIKAKVCKMEGLEKCEVNVGKLVLTPKAGVQITQDQVQTVLSTAGEYTLSAPTATK